MSGAKFIYTGLCLIYLMTNIFSLSAQDTLHISLEELISRAEKNNLRLNINQKDVLSAQADYELSKAVYLPIIKVENNGSFTNNPLNAFGFKLQEEKITQADFNPVVLNDPDFTELFTTKLEIQQPLVNLDGVHARKAAKSAIESKQYQWNRLREHIELEITNTYLQLQLLFASAQVIKDAQKTAEENLKITRDLLEEGYVKKADELEVMLHISDIQNQLLTLSNNIRTSSQVLSYLTGSDESFIVQPTDEIKTGQVISEFNPEQLNLRSDILAFDKGIEAQQHMIKSQKMKRVPRFNALGNYQWNDDNFLGFNGGSYTFGFSLSWNVFNGYKDIGTIKKSEILLDKTRTEKEDLIAKSTMEISNEFRKMENIQDRIKVQELAIEHAVESWRIRKNL